MAFVRIFIIQFLTVIIPTVVLAAEEASGGMITIEVVEDPSFMELYGNYVYTGIIIIALGVFFWRRFQQGKRKV